MSNLTKTKVLASQSDRFAVYCGDGVYVHGVNCEAGVTVLEVGPLEGALNASRRVAIAALHTARRAGFGAWLVQHPESADYPQRMAA